MRTGYACAVPLSRVIIQNSANRRMNLRTFRTPRTPEPSEPPRTPRTPRTFRTRRTPRTFLRPPATMHPQPKFRVPSDVHLENIGATLRELSERMFRCGCRWFDGVLVDHPESSATKRQGKEWHDAGSGSQRQGRYGRRRCRRSVEKIHVDRIAT